MDENSKEETSGTSIQEIKSDRWRASHLLPTEREGVETVKILIENAAWSGKMSYVTKLDKCYKQPCLAQFVKAMANFQQFNDEHSSVLENLEERTFYIFKWQPQNSNFGFFRDLDDIWQLSTKTCVSC